MTQMPRLSSRAVAVSALTLLLAGPAVGPALADSDGKGGGKKGGSGGRSADHRRDSGARGEQQARQGGSRGSGDSRGSGVSTQREPRVARAGSGQDPAGNNGTMKVDGLPFDDGLGNEPHVECGFRLKLYGFDEGQTGDVTIAGHAPSGSGVVSERTGVLLSDDAAGGGPNDVDEVLTYTLDDLDLSGLTAHPQQGYHVKVTLSTDAPGGVKHKVFWIEPCEVPEVGGADVGGVDLEVGDVETTTEDRAAVLGVRLTREQAAPRAAVLGSSMERAPLAFTGTFADWLIALGSGLVAAGTGALVWARRRRTALS